MIYCNDYDDARMMAISLLSDSDCTVKSLILIPTHDGAFKLQYEDFDYDEVEKFCYPS